MEGKHTLTNSLPSLFSVPRAWFLNTTSSSQRRFMLKSWELSRGLPRAISTSRCSSSSAARSRSCYALASVIDIKGVRKRDTSFSFCSNRSFLIFSSSRINSAASSSSSLRFVSLFVLGTGSRVRPTYPRHCCLLLTRLSRHLCRASPPIYAGVWPLGLPPRCRHRLPLGVQLRVVAWGLRVQQ